MGLSLEDARRQILEPVQPLAPLDLPLAEAYGCVLARDVVAEYDLPPFSGASGEGFAARSADVATASREAPVALRVVGRVARGRPPEVTVGWGEAVGVASGAPLPAGADCVIPAGRYAVQGEMIQVLEGVDPGDNVDPAGEDVRAGTVLVPAGRRLAAPELGILATAGLGSALAFPRVRVGVLSIGDLVEPGRPAGFGQVRDSVSYLLVGALRDLGAVPYRIGIVRDAEADLRETLLSNLSRADAFVASGGLDRDEDPVGTVLSGIGDVRTVRVEVYPGSWVGFGTVEEKPFFRVPPKAVSAFVAFELFARPAFLRTMGRRDVRRPEVRAVLDESVTGPAGVTLMVPARVEPRDGAWHAVPTGSGGEGLVGSVVRANGLVVVPPGDTAPPAGTEVRVQVFRPLER